MSKKELYRTFFNKIDPAGIFFEENIDEYDPEIQDLLASNIDFRDFEILKNKLTDLFERYFEGIVIDNNKIKELALLIYKEELK